jgi:hypothetical protein
MLHDQAKAAVLQAIRSGHSVRSIDREELGLPDKGTISLWLNTDLVFAAAFAQAEEDRGRLSKQRKRHRRRERFSERAHLVMTAQLRCQILASINAGKTLHQTLEAEGMPDRHIVGEYAKTDLDFAGQLSEARRRVESSNGWIRYTKEQYRKACDAFASAITVRAVEFKVEGLPNYDLLVRRSKRDDAFAVLFKSARSSRIRGMCEGGMGPVDPLRSARGASLAFGEDARQRFLALIASGMSQSAALKLEGMPDAGTVLRYRKINLEFASGFNEARENRPAARKSRRPVYQTAVLRGQLLQEELYRAADAAVGHGLPEHIRDDVKSDLIEAVLLNSFPIEEMAERAAAFVTAHNRRMETYSSKSLDQPLSEDTEMTFLDRLTTDAHDYAD